MEQVWILMRERLEVLRAFLTWGWEFKTVFRNSLADVIALG